MRPAGTFFDIQLSNSRICKSIKKMMNSHQKDDEFPSKRCWILMEKMLDCHRK